MTTAHEPAYPEDGLPTERYIAYHVERAKAGVEQRAREELGLIREGKGLTSRLFGKNELSTEEIRKEIEDGSPYREKVSTSVDIPLSADSKRVLGYAAEEAERRRRAEEERLRREFPALANRRLDPGTASTAAL